MRQQLSKYCKTGISIVLSGILSACLLLAVLSGCAHGTAPLDPSKCRDMGVYLLVQTGSSGISRQDLDYLNLLYYIQCYRVYKSAPGLE